MKLFGDLTQLIGSFFHHLRIEALAAAVGLGEKKSAAIHVVAELLGKLLAAVGVLGQRALAAAKIKDRRLEQVLGGRPREVHDLPGQVALPARFRIARQVGHVAAVVVPIVAVRVAVLELGQQDRPASPSRETTAHSWSRSAALPQPASGPSRSRRGCPGSHEMLGAPRVPIGPARLARRPQRE